MEFVCGNRALKDYTWKSNYIRDISNLLSAKDKDVYNRVKLYSQKESWKKKIGFLEKSSIVIKPKNYLKKLNW